MQIQLKGTNEHPLLAGRTFDILRDGEKVGWFFKGRDGRWNAQIVRNRAEPLSDFNRTSYAYSNYHAMIRLIACYLLGDDERIPYLQRGIWTNPCPVPEVI